MNHGLVVLSGKLNGQQRAAAQLSSDREDHRCLRVTNIPFGSLRIIIRRRFDQMVTLINHAVFGYAAFRTPAAVLYPALDCPIERSSVSACLPAGDDLHRESVSVAQP